MEETSFDGSLTIRRIEEKNFEQSDFESIIPHEDGHLILHAEDGRNITVEYSDLDVHKAIRVIDVYGDPTNLSDSVAPAQYAHHGDIVNLEFDTDGTYSDQAVIEGSWSLVDDVNLDQTGNHRAKNDYVDYYAEIIKPGGIGEATYRIKAEAVPSGGIDSEPESGLFTRPTREQPPIGPAGELDQFIN